VVNISPVNPDLGDLDGDGELDAIDIVVLEEGERFLPASKQNTGCCLVPVITS